MISVESPAEAQPLQTSPSLDDSNNLDSRFSREIKDQIFAYRKTPQSRSHFVPASTGVRSSCKHSETIDQRPDPTIRAFNAISCDVFSDLSQVAPRGGG